MSRTNQLDPALRDGARSEGLLLRANLIDNDHFRHMILDRLDHYMVLQFGFRHLHPAGPADCRMRNISVARNLVASIDNNNALLELLGENSGDLSQFRRFAPARTAQYQN